MPYSFPMLYTLLYAVPYIALFGIALMMPGRRSLTVFAVVLGAPLAWLAWEFFRSMGKAPGGAILGVILGAVFIFSAIAGLVAGVATRAVMLRVSRIGRSRMRSGIVVVTGILTLPSLLAASMWWSQQKVRVPDQACLTATHHVQIAGAKFWLPSAPIFTPWTGEKKPYSFSSHQRMRSFCGISLDAENPVKLVNLSIDTAELSFEGQPQRDKFCASSQRDWAKQLCAAGRATAGSSSRFPEKISVYSPTEYDHKRMLISHHGAYAAFLSSGKPLQASQTADFIRYANGYWIARDETWKNDAGEPFTLHCSDTPPAGMLYCSTTYRLRLGPQVTYRFRADQDELASVSKTIDANFHALMNDLRTR